MQSSANSSFALRFDSSSIITKLASVRDAQTLPSGAVVGDLHGGLTFTDAVAAALENRSVGGWQELPDPGGQVWTIIVLNR